MPGVGEGEGAAGVVGAGAGAVVGGRVAGRVGGAWDGPPPEGAASVTTTCRVALATPAWALIVVVPGCRAVTVPVVISATLGSEDAQATEARTAGGAGEPSLIVPCSASTAVFPAGTRPGPGPNARPASATRGGEL